MKATSPHFAIHVTELSMFWLEIKEGKKKLKLISSFVLSLLISVLHSNFLGTSVQIKGFIAKMYAGINISAAGLEFFPLIIFRGNIF